MTPEKKTLVSVFLSPEDFSRLEKIVRERGVSKGDFIRAAIRHPESLPRLKTRPLTGIAHPGSPARRRPSVHRPTPIRIPRRFAASLSLQNSSSLLFIDKAH